jgi:hypothetical protein
MPLQSPPEAEFESKTWVPRAPGKLDIGCGRVSLGLYASSMLCHAKRARPYAAQQRRSLQNASVAQQDDAILYLRHASVLPFYLIGLTALGFSMQSSCQLLTASLACPAATVLMQHMPTRCRYGLADHRYYLQGLLVK